MAGNETLTGSGMMADDEGRSEVNRRIDDQLTIENIRNLMDKIEGVVGDLDEEDYSDICDHVRSWVCETFSDQNEDEIAQ